MFFVSLAVSRVEMPPTNVTTDGDVPPVPAPPTKGGAGAGVAVDPPAPPAPSSTDGGKAKKEGETSSENMTRSVLIDLSLDALCEDRSAPLVARDEPCVSLLLL